MDGDSPRSSVNDRQNNHAAKLQQLAVDYVASQEAGARQRREAAAQRAKYLPLYNAAWQALDDALASRNAPKIAAAVADVAITSRNLSEGDELGGIARRVSRGLARRVGHGTDVADHMLLGDYVTPPRGNHAILEGLAHAIAAAASGEGFTLDDAATLLVLLGHDPAGNEASVLRRYDEAMTAAYRKSLESIAARIFPFEGSGQAIRPMAADNHPAVSTGRSETATKQNEKNQVGRDSIDIATAGNDAGSGNERIRTDGHVSTDAAWLSLARIKADLPQHRGILQRIHVFTYRGDDSEIPYTDWAGELGIDLDCCAAVVGGTFSPQEFDLERWQPCGGEGRVHLLDRGRRAANDWPAESHGPMHFRTLIGQLQNATPAEAELIRILDGLGNLLKRVGDSIGVLPTHAGGLFGWLNFLIALAERGELTTVRFERFAYWRRAGDNVVAKCYADAPEAVEKFAKAGLDRQRLHAAIDNPVEATLAALDWLASKQQELAKDDATDLAKKAIALPRSDAPCQRADMAESQEAARSKKKGGRPAVSDAAQDRRVLEAWETKQHTDYKALADALGGDWTRRTVELAIGRERKRRQREADK